MNQAITITFVPEQVITWLIIGLVAGFLAGALVRGRRFGLITSIIVGLIGALVGGFLFTVLRIQVPPGLEGSLNIRVIDILVSFIGAVVVLFFLGLFYRTRRI